MDNILPQNTLNPVRQKNDVLPDSSSLILLQSAGILELVCHYYTLLLVPSVFEEITEAEKPGANFFVYLQKKNLLHLLTGSDISNTPMQRAELGKMGKGESELLANFLSGAGSFVVVDDLRAAKFCVRHEIPFINALLIPRILMFADVLSGESADEYFSLIQQRGRYSVSILKRAESFQHEDLERFFPDS
ncbi:hypothetical protein [Desulfosediminicola flagellatus]|uniref:hypothetical protein n=1 Tax=Desulfosediminicola flagellatus TaxID=2569541 RepID=UPI0010ACB3A6|nr:hypothetical protein [Desulfosediminicola flagellatus]